jgi:hypothetical protein
MFKLTDKDIDRFWAKVHRRKPDQCWNWIGGSRHWKGYGLFTLANGKPGGVKHVASRIACFLAHGPAPEGKPHALHTCDNPPCCNGAHLYWGAQKQNTRDMMERGQYSPPPRNAAYRRRDTQPKGENNHKAKLNETAVREIWRLHMAGVDCGTIAKTVGFTHTCVYDVCRGRTWQHLSDAPSIAQLKAGGVRRGFNQFPPNA